MFIVFTVRECFCILYAISKMWSNGSLSFLWTGVSLQWYSIHFADVERHEQNKWIFLSKILQNFMLSKWQKYCKMYPIYAQNGDFCWENLQHCLSTVFRTGVVPFKWRIYKSPLVIKCSCMFKRFVVIAFN